MSMGKSLLDLTALSASSLRNGPQPETVSLALDKYSPVVDIGDTVAPGTLVAKACIPENGDLHSPIFGTVQEIRGFSERFLIIKVTQGLSECTPCSAKAIDMSQVQPQELRSTLARLGHDMSKLCTAKTLIINAMPHEPNITLHNLLLKEYKKDIARGLEAVKIIVAPTAVFLASINLDASGLGNCTAKNLGSEYPASLDQLVIYNITGSETAEDTVIISALELFLIGRSVASGLPCTETVLSINGHNVLVKIGTYIADLLAQAELVPQEKDRLLLGGSLRGKAIYDIYQGVEKFSLALTLIPQNQYQPTQDTPCLNCGECVAHCPARIQPCLISRAAEFSLYDKARDYGAQYCMECGLCGYYCPGRRPLLQYIRLAKQKLRELDALNSLQTAGGDAQ